jgi:hypothetical protein
VVDFLVLRKARTAHRRHPFDNARGNAEVLLELKEMGLKVNLA